MTIKAPAGGEQVVANDITANAEEVVTPLASEAGQNYVERREPPKRDLASEANPWGDFDKEFGVGAHDPVNAAPVDPQINKDKLLTGMTQEIVNNLGTMEKTAINLALTPASLAEDMYNSGVDIVNSVSSLVGGEDLLENANNISRFLPKGAGYEMSREIGKFILSYAGVLKGVSAVTGGKPTKSMQIGAGALSEFILAKPEMETLTENLVQKIPGIGAPIYEYLNADDQGPVEHRLKNAILGVAEGEAAAFLFKAIKHLRKTRVMEKTVLPDDLPKIPDEGATPPKVPDEVSDIPKVVEPDLPPPVPVEVFKPSTGKAVRDLKFKMKTGEGARNAVEMVDDKGNQVYMNLTTMDIEDDVRRITSNIMESNPERYSKETFTTEDMIHIADNLGVSPEELAVWTRDSGLKPGHILAATDLTMQSAESTLAALKKFEQGDITEEVMAGFLGKSEELISRLRDMKSAAGLMLKEADVKLKKGDTDAIKTATELARVYGTDVKAMAKASQGWNMKANQFIKAVKDKAVVPIADRIISMRYSGMLSAIPTHTRNMYGNAVNGVTRVGETFLAASINAVERNPRGVHFGDSYHELIGMGHGIMDALKVSASKIKGGDRKFIGVNPNKAKLPQFVKESSAEATSSVGKFVNFLDKQVVQGQFVGEALQFEDNFAKHINAMMTGRREAYRNGRFLKEGMEGAKNPKTVEEIKEAVSKAINKELDDPSKGTLSKMYKDAEYNTFTNDVEGSMLKKLEGISATPLGRLIVPFAKVNLNALSYKLERIPGLNLFLEKSWRDIRSNDVVTRQTAQARVAFASTTMLGLGAYLHGTDSITGSGVKEAGKFRMFEQSGRLQGAIRVGDTWIEYRKETPMGGILSMVADIAEIIDGADGQNDKFIQDAASAYTSVVMEAYNPDYLSENMSALFTALNDSDIKGVEKIVKLGMSVTESFTPYSGMARSLNRSLTDEGSIKREINNPGDHIATMLAKIKNVYVPGKLPVKKNILGYPMFHKEGLGPDLISPFGVNKETDNPVIQELARLSGASHLITPKATSEIEADLSDSFINISMPPKIVNRNVGKATQSVRLTLEEYSELIEYTSGRTKEFRGMTLEKTMTSFMKNRAYKEASFKTQGVIMKKVLDAYRKVGTAIHSGTPVSMDKLEEGIRAATDLLVE